MMRTPLRILLVLTSQATMGDELLNREWFRSRTEAKVLIERWRQFYNEQRPHSAHAYKPPATIRRNWINPIASPPNSLPDWLQSSYSGHLGAGTEGGATRNGCSHRLTRTGSNSPEAPASSSHSD